MDSASYRDVKKISDEELVLLLKNQFDPRLFNELIQRHEPAILKKCAAYVNDEDAAEDLCQDILIKIYLQLNTFRSSARFTTWLHAITHNFCMDHLRRNKKNFYQEITGELAEEMGEIIAFEEEKNYLSEDLLHALLEQIPPEDKLILIMKYKEKLSLHEMRAILNIRESALKMRLKRAKEKIRNLFLASRNKS